MRAEGIYDETALFFFADHGDFTGDYGLVEKTQNTFEDCLTHVPLVVKPPRTAGVKPRVSDAMVELVDFSATVWELTGVEPPFTAFGRSLLPLLRGETDDHRDAVFCEGGRLTGERQAMELESYEVPGLAGPGGLYWPRVSLQVSDERPWHGKGTMCRTKDFKYVRRLYEKDEFYDLRRDPRELANRIDDPDCAGEVARHKDRLLRWYQETCDVVPPASDKR
ncbi:MAG: sulfatase-like hydrolase/transferase [bacterium]|nr:sulfatase-like hydrolase/transferase [bacterium]